MKRMLALLLVLLSASAVFVSAVGASTSAATDCLQVQLSGQATVCAGQSAEIRVTVVNSCSTRERVTARLTLDGQTLPYTTTFGIAGNSTLSRQLTIPVPASAQPGSHTITIDITDAAGDEASATLHLTLSSCDAK